MLTVFAIIGVICTISFIVFAINSNNNQNYHVPTVSPNQQMLGDFIVSDTIRIIKNDKRLAYLQFEEYRERLETILLESYHNNLSSKQFYSMQYNLPVDEVERIINFCFKALEKQYPT